MDSPTPADRMRVVTGNGKGNGLPLVVWVAIGVVLLILLGGTAVLVATGKVSFLQLPGTAKTTTQAKNLTPAQQLTAAQTELQQASTPVQKATAYQHVGEAYLLTTSQGPQAVTALQNAQTQAANTVLDSHTKAQLLSDLALAYAQTGRTAEEIATIKQLIPLLKQSPSKDDQAVGRRYQGALENLQSQAGIQ